MSNEQLPQSPNADSPGNGMEDEEDGIRANEGVGVGGVGVGGGRGNGNEISIETTARPLTRRPELTEELKEEINEVFELFASANSGYVERRQLKTMMKLLGYEPRKEQLNRILTQCGISQRSNKIEYGEFHNIMLLIMNEKDIQEEMARAFSLFDIDNTGKISFENLKKVAENLGEKMTDSELHEMIKEADLNKDGVVDETEFVRIMKKTDLW